MPFNSLKRVKRTTSATVIVTDNSGNKLGVTYFELNSNNPTHVAMLEKLKTDPDYQFDCNVILNKESKL